MGFSLAIPPPKFERKDTIVKQMWYKTKCGRCTKLYKKCRHAPRFPIPTIYEFMTNKIEKTFLVVKIHHPSKPRTKRPTSNTRETIAIRGFKVNPEEYP